MTKTTTPQVVIKAIEDAIRLLNITKCQYKVISPTGDEFGSLEVAPKKKKRHVTNRAYGELSAHYDKHIDYTAAPGDCVRIPLGKYTGHEIRAGAFSKLSTLWGKKTYKTVITDDEVQILRTA
jgi:hypothetical protein